MVHNCRVTWAYNQLINVFTSQSSQLTSIQNWLLTHYGTAWGSYRGTETSSDDIQYFLTMFTLVVIGAIYPQQTTATVICWLAVWWSCKQSCLFIGNQIWPFHVLKIFRLCSVIWYLHVHDKLKMTFPSSSTMWAMTSVTDKWELWIDVSSFLPCINS